MLKSASATECLSRCVRYVSVRPLALGRYVRVDRPACSIPTSRSSVSTGAQIRRD
jgi:hypothetical protein